MGRLVNPYWHAEDEGGGGPAHPTLNVDLQCHYKLDEDAAAVRNDSTSAGIDLGAYNSPGSVTGLIGQALERQWNVQAWLQSAVDSRVEIYQDFSVSIWWKVDANNATSSVLRIMNAGWSLQLELRRGSFNDVVEFQFDGSPSNVVVESGDTQLGAWNHFVATYEDSTGNIEVFQNSVSEGSAAGPFTPSAATGDRFLVVGYYQSNEGLTGGVDEVALWHKKLSQSEIDDLYNGGAGLTYDTGIPGFPDPSDPNTLLEGLQCHYKMDEDGTPRADSHGTLDLTATNSPTRGDGVIDGSVGGLSTASVDHAENAAFKMDQDTSFSFWIWLSATSGNQYSVCAGGNVAAPNNQWKMTCRGSIKQIRFYFQIGGIPSSYLNLILDATNAWQHVVITYNSTSGVIEAFVSSVYKTTITLAAPDAWTTGQRFWIGKPPSLNGAQINIDEFAIWHKVLTQEEIDTLYNSGAGITYPFV